MADAVPRVSEYEELKSLILGEDREVLDGLAHDLRDPGRRARHLAEVLPQALGEAGRHGDGLTGALQAPVTDCIKRSVQRDSRLFADALYPAMGPAIRKSIGEALKGLVQSLNQALEHSLSLRGLRWRWQAWRSGVPFAEVVIKNTLIYRVEETYLIHQASGLLIERVGQERGDRVPDEEAVSAMLTAIRQFMRDAFAAAADGDLQTVDMGELTLWVVRGPYASMACVIRGIPPQELRDRLMALLEELHAAYGPMLEDFSGDRAALSGITPALAPSLETELRAGRRGNKPRYRPLLLLLLLAGVVISAGLWQLERTRQAEQARRQAHIQSLIRALEAEPGITPLDWRMLEGRLLVTGLRDPLARDPGAVAKAAGAAPGEVAFRLAAYQSLEPALVLARARRQLAPPSGVELALEGGVLRVTGQATPEWYDRIQRQTVLPVGTEGMELDGLREDRAAMRRQIHAELAPPDGVEIELQGRTLHLVGVAPKSWLDAMETRLAAVGWLEGCVDDGVEIAEWREVEALRGRIEALTLHFAEDMTLTPRGREDLAAAAALLQRLFELDRLLQLQAEVTLVGHSDGIGTEHWNLWLRGQRGETVRAALVERGLDGARLRVRVDPDFTPSAQPDPNQRRVRLRLALTPPRAHKSSCR